jgi:hypothetical protein
LSDVEEVVRLQSKTKTNTTSGVSPNIAAMIREPITAKHPN